MYKTKSKKTTGHRPLSKILHLHRIFSNQKQPFQQPHMYESFLNKKPWWIIKKTMTLYLATSTRMILTQTTWTPTIQRHSSFNSLRRTTYLLTQRNGTIRDMILTSNYTRQIRTFFITVNSDKDRRQSYVQTKLAMMFSAACLQEVARVCCSSYQLALSQESA